FTGPDTVEVGGRVLRFRRAVIATGARAVRPDIPGLADAGFLTNETVFTLTELPRRLAVLGAGPGGCELAQAVARFGSAVSPIRNRPQLLPREAPDAARMVEQAMRRDGVPLVLGCNVVRVVREGAENVLHLEHGGKPMEVRADAILVGTGRAPNVGGLGL